MILFRSAKGISTFLETNQVSAASLLLPQQRDSDDQGGHVVEPGKVDVVGMGDG